MTSKSRPTSSKLNNFFKFRISSKETTLHETLRLDSAKPSDPIDANEIVQQLVPGANSLQSRLRTLDELSKIILSYPFQHISELWIAVEDLLEAGVPHNARKAAWSFMIACIRGQFEDLGMLRAVFYQAINNHEIWEDFGDKLQALKELTNDGRDVYGFEKNIVRLLAHWIASSFEQAKKSTTSLASLSSTPQLILLQKPIPHFDTTMALLINVVKFNFVFFDELEIASLLDLLHTICINAPEDTAHTIGFLDVIVRYGYIPQEGLSTFLKILCHTTLSDVYQERAWMITLNLMKSHSAHSAIRLLCLNLRSKGEVASSVAHTRVIQGSIRLLQRSVWGSTPIDTLSVSFSTILWSLKSAVDFKSKDVNQDIVASLGALLETHADDLRDLEYEIIMDILERLTDSVKEKPVGEHPSTKPFVFGLEGHATSLGHQPHPNNAFRDAYGGLLYQFITLYNRKRIPGVAARLMTLLASLQDHLPEDTMLLLLDYYYTEHQFYPYTLNWLERLHHLVQVSVIQDKRPKVRSRALQIALDVYDASMDFFHDAIVTAVFLDVFDHMDSETDPVLASQVSDLLIRATRTASDDLFPRLLDRIVQNIRCSCHAPKQPTSAIACQSLSAVIGIIDLFQHALYDPNGASRVDTFFSLLVGLAINQDVLKASRLVLLDFLLCLRVDLDHRIFCSTPSTIDSMASATEQLLSEDTRQDRGDRPGLSGGHARNLGSGPSAQASSAARQQIGPSTAHPTHNWKQLMQGRTMQASPYVILNIPLYMTGLLSILEQERNFEVYSFVIQRLPSQLFNKHLFCNSSEQITKLHSVLVDMTLRDKFPESLRNLPLSAKRHNIHILAYKVLVILLCYNNKFSTNELHDLVHAFVVGLQRQATCAKICIHALAVCCYELPQSMTKHLPGTVLKLSQIMSTATISVHILEFLSTVARLPMLYSNFVENDYKRVFGIALKYIQYTHSVASNTTQAQAPSTPSSVSSPNSPAVSTQVQPSAATRALPQYVLIMAYQVIDVWFMLQRLPERRKYVPYIVRNLLMANEPGKRVDEQTETCMDMLARYSYANCEPKPKPSLIQQILIGPTGKTGKVVTKTWLQGNAFITVRTAHSVGWAEITVRRASGTVSFLLKIENDMFMSGADAFELNSLPGLMRLQEDALAIDAAAQRPRNVSVGGDTMTDSEHVPAPSAESEGRREEAQHLAASNAEGARSFSKAKIETFVDPSFLFMQLTSYPDVMARDVPILLAEDDTTNRALGVLDRTPVVDFHKIGVVYVGKGQSKEGEILGNTHGSSEYTKFLTGLGSLVRLKNAKIYAGGLDLEMDLDGEYAYSHQDEITQMIFHVATMMPNYPHDVNFDGKKRHIGNDWVTIVFNDSGADYDFGTISGQFNFMTLVVTPVSMASVVLAPTTTTMGANSGPSMVQPFKNVWFQVVMLRRPDMPEIGPLATSKIISATELPRFTRQMALHANIYAQVYYQHLQNSVEYVSNWQERLRQIKRVKDRLAANAASNAGQGSGAGGPGQGSIAGGANSTSGGGPGGSGHGGSRAGAGPNGASGGSSNNSSGAAGGGNSSSIGLGLGLGLGLGSSSSSSGANGAGNQGSGSGSQGQQGQQQQHQTSIMGLEPVVDFTRYS
ncbi:MAG: hypothetical protein JOS17DRAFT_680334 [Linnemannia elongata]|nr:MAG: hypothetical protein JOS17DRAFT_680334 [Linnemannia elongata]